jgi:hypothetical protein
MQKFKVIKPIHLQSGVLELSSGQARERTHAVRSLGADRFRILHPVQFKVGEEFGFEGDLPKAFLTEHLLDSIQDRPKSASTNSAQPSPSFQRKPKGKR